MTNVFAEIEGRDRSRQLSQAGYFIAEGVLSPGECEIFGHGLVDGQLTRGRAGARHLMKSSQVRRLASDERLLCLAAEALGSHPIPYRATLFDKSGRANWLVVWHQDTALPLASRIESAEWGPW